jgi:hypothetical protein
MWSAIATTFVLAALGFVMYYLGNAKRVARRIGADPREFHQAASLAVRTSLAHGAEIPAIALDYFTADATRDWALAVGYVEGSREVRAIETGMHLELPPLMRFQITFDPEERGSFVKQAKRQGR